MTKRLVLTHRISETLNRPVHYATQWLRLHPAPQPGTTVKGYTLRVEPRSHFINWLRDPYGNRVARLDFPEPVKEMKLRVEMILHPPVAASLAALEPWAAHWPFTYQGDLAADLAPYLVAPARGCSELVRWLEELEIPPGRTLAVLEGVAAACSRTAVTPVRCPPDLNLEALVTRGEWSPWALAWLATMALRHLGLAARFVSGYRLREGDGLTAWTEAFVPGAGWVALDPVSGNLADADRLPLVRVPDPMAALPVEGYREAAEAHWDEEVDLALLAPAPHREETHLDSAERLVQARVETNDLRLQVSRSLVFTAAHPHHLPEWRFAADGEDKHGRGLQLLERLRERLARGGIVHFGQGEWYAGESAPRWHRSLCWRIDGMPLWLADLPPAGDHDLARELLAEALGIAPDSWIPAFEDPLAKAAEPGPPPALLATPEGRLDLAKGLSTPGEVCGWVLPLAWDPIRGRFHSGRWRFRRHHLFLAPGNFPIGYRLPLESLCVPDDQPFEAERDPFEPYGPLPDYRALLRARVATSPDPLKGETPRTALCMEVRGGQLYAFIPPLPHLEAWLELLAAVNLGFGSNVLVEGYPPPADPRLRCIELMPEAGTIRLQLPPVSDLEEGARLLETTYETAQACGLTGKRSRGGPAQPTGNGPFVLAGHTPADSPFLRRPGLLRSLISYVQHHPCLCYGFAGPWIGPDGPAPRVDEGRPDTLYELSLALEQLREGDCRRPWLTDRVLRHLLDAPDGDGRRAEISIANLYPPHRAAERRGEVVMNAFSTPVDAQSARLQALLVTAILARLATAPFHPPLRRFGRELYDRYLLPAVLWEDLRAVIDDLNAHGIPLQAEWFSPLFEQRFPPLATERFGALILELRPALEPWPLLAETFGARFLDNANARVQARVSGLVQSRHLLLCNGLEVPLAPCGSQHVAGVRHKATAPPRTLNPTLEPAVVLTFELVDLRQGKVIGGIGYSPVPGQLPAPSISTPSTPRPGATLLPALPSPPSPLPLTEGRPHLYHYAARPFTEPPRRAAETRPYLLDLTRRPSTR